METLSWMVLDHFREYNAWPWAYFNSPAKQWQEHPSFVVGELLFIALTCLSFAHAWTVPDKDGGRRLKLVWVASFVVGVANDYIFMMLPVVDNFWQAQAIVMLTPRMPLYIPCVYNGFMYWPAVAASRIFHHKKKSPIAEAALGGLLGCMLYAPYDVCGARFLWWTWHDSDPGVRGRWLGVPAGSTSWTLTFVFSFVLLLRKASDMGWSQPKSLALACLSTPLMIAILNVFTVLGGDEIGAPDVGTVLAAAITAAVVVLRELVRPTAETPEVAAANAAAPKVHAPEPVVFRLGLLAYFATLVAVMATFSPEKQISTGAHQVFGPCDATDFDLLGFQRNRYICGERYPDWYFQYSCGETLEGATGRWAHVSPWEAAKGSKDGTASWFTICGRPHESFKVWMSAEVALTVSAAVAFLWALSTFTRPGAAVEAPPAERKRRLTAVGNAIKGLLDPLYAKLAEKHWNIATALLIVVQSALMFLAGHLLNTAYPPGNEGAYLKGAWNLMKAMPFSGRSAFPIFFSGMVHVGVCCTYLALDRRRPAFIQANLRQRRGPGDWDHGLLRTIKSQSMCFAFAAAPLFLMQVARNGPSLYTAPWMATCLDQCEQALPDAPPSLVEFVIHMAFCLVTFNYAYWYVHWQLHRNRHLYKHIHSIHHEYKEPFVTVGPHLHPMEFNVVFVFALVAPIACRAHPFTWIVWFSLNTIFGLEDHTGLAETPVGWFFDKVTLGHWGGSNGHNLHHAVIWGNYEPYLITWDWLCGTDVHMEDVATATPEWDSSAAASKEAETEDVRSAKQEAPKAATRGGPKERAAALMGTSGELVRRSRNATPPPRPR